MEGKEKKKLQTGRAQKREHLDKLLDTAQPDDCKALNK